jgi:hypothetical protein
MLGYQHRAFHLDLPQEPPLIPNLLSDDGLPLLVIYSVFLENHVLLHKDLIEVYVGVGVQVDLFGHGVALVLGLRAD